MNFTNAIHYFQSCGFQLTAQGSCYLLAVLGERECSALGRFLSRKYQTMGELWDVWRTATIRAARYEACDQWIAGLLLEDRMDDYARVMEALGSAPRLPKDLQDEMDMMLMGLPQLPRQWRSTSKRLLTQRFMTS